MRSEINRCSLPQQEIMEVGCHSFYIIDKLRKSGFHITPILGNVQDGYEIRSWYDPVDMVTNFIEIKS
jgi:hypothetical protein